MRRGLTIIVSGPDPDRLRSALGIAAAEAALGGKVRLFFDAGSVSLLAALPAALQPLRDAALDLGVQVFVCQTGLAEQDIRLDPRFEAAGLVALMAGLGEDRLLLA
ncbi:DsrE family protein [Sphingomonas sp. BIUV-7]|uniref:DsrE family protein n=1 Tax=Sphingomonas natans TaxID=3063330 RepID=A0ABT8Y5V7_9SPHN|nr:DsrE family protein [Sphingomonas sp. BIUV-7]MDO6413382.1 DsrE family protein [Sphingomonas sp. BIUV-7]